MTTEIAVINRLGVALAADSAVTIPGYDSDKVFHTGDKLFELSEVHPVALMVNGSMDFLGVPWELIAKEFRCTLPEGAGKITIKQWMDHFLKFIANHQAVKPDDVRRWLEGLIEDELDYLKETVSERLGVAASKDLDESFQAVARRFYVEAMAERIEELLKEPTLDSLATMTEDDLLPTVRSTVMQLTDVELPFEEHDEHAAYFNRLVALRLLKEVDRVASTGLIVCGFGSNDLFPSLYAVEIDGYVAGRLRYSMSHDVEINRGEETGNAISFAQTDVVDRLLKGADNRFIDWTKEFIRKNVEGTFERSFARAKLKIVRADGAEVPAKEVGGFVGTLIENLFEKKMATDVTQEFQRNFNATIALMPKQDLIELAEALVSITAIERKASSGGGAIVGGPIDVALITRAEGFVWIKRKHHFTADLNPRYMWRRFKAKVAAEGEDATTRK
jgi:hypothetical protein